MAEMGFDDRGRDFLSGSEDRRVRSWTFEMGKVSTMPESVLRDDKSFKLYIRIIQCMKVEGASKKSPQADRAEQSQRRNVPSSR